jgi:DNA-binding SARP family transcriptional activator
MLRLQLLGKFVLAREDQRVALPLGARRLLAYLALNGPTARPVIMGALWPNVGERHARGCLRTMVWRLNRDEPRLVGPVGDALVLRPEIAVDTRAFSDSAHSILHGSLPPAAERAVLRVGDLLPGWYDDWVIFERERLRQLRLHAQDALVSRLAADGRYDDALDAAIESARLEPLRESAHRAIIAIHLAEGNAAEALRHYELFGELLRAELGIEPSPQLTGMLPV